MKFVYSSNIGMDDHHFHCGNFLSQQNRNNPREYVMFKCTLFLALFKLLKEISELMPGISDDVFDSVFVRKTENSSLFGTSHAL